jgi:hypothetical protein
MSRIFYTASGIVASSEAISAESASMTPMQVTESVTNLTDNRVDKNLRFSIMMTLVFCHKTGVFDRRLPGLSSVEAISG